MSDTDSKLIKEASDIPQTGPEAIEYALANLDIDELEKFANDELKGGKKTRRPRAIALLNIINGMRRNDQTPSDYMISSVPVIPAKFRPFAASSGTLIPGDANVLYKDLFDIKEAHDEERGMFGDEFAGQSRLALYDAVKSVYGYGDPVKAKTKAKDIKGFLKKLVGSTAKYSFVQSKLLAKTQDNVGRSTIVVDPELGLDEIGMPEDMAFVTYAPYIQRRLKQLGLSNVEALKNLKDRTPAAQRALQLEMENRPLIYSRAPAWHSHSVLAGKPKLIKGSALAINPYVTSGLGADFDGDNQLNVIELCINEEALSTTKKWGNRGVNQRQMVNYYRLQEINKI